MERIVGMPIIAVGLVYLFKYGLKWKWRDGRPTLFKFGEIDFGFIIMSLIVISIGVVIRDGRIEEIIKQYIEGYRACIDIYKLICPDCSYWDRVKDCF